MLNPAVKLLLVLGVLIAVFAAYWFVVKEDYFGIFSEEDDEQVPNGTGGGGTGGSQPINGYTVRIKDSGNKCIAVKDNDSIIGDGDDVRLETCIPDRLQHQWYITNETLNHDGITYRRIESMADRTKCLDYDGGERQGGQVCDSGCGAYEARTCEENNNHYFNFVNGDIEGSTRIKRLNGNQECLHWYVGTGVGDNTFGNRACDGSSFFNVERV